MASASQAFKSNQYTWQDTITTTAKGLATYQIVQAIGTDTTFEIATLQASINAICFPLNTTRILPSPFSSQVNIVINSPDAINKLGIQISDMQGRIVYKRIASKPVGYFNWPIYSAGWQSGMYKVSLYNGSNRFFDQK
ncbi:T9SS type A sorting domain-containing protein [Paraflavitalea speifideaquila]|uniref:T9SS type A sorting domain-containing protein n=1 Tax=Paraflavitalea speifideaquila TaxID=3076558 RepID=UPI0028EA89FC|nr:T9SS type A sorting domain-containing protein [Paraflavitalea speifideiaquila]